jgi:hypothetical protein
MITQTWGGLLTIVDRAWDRSQATAVPVHGQGGDG